MSRELSTDDLTFLSTPPRGGRLRSAQQHTPHHHFYPRLREEGDRGRSRGRTSLRRFYPRPPRGGDGTTPETLSIRSRFLSTPSARRRPVQADSLRHPGAFLSTPSARRATEAAHGDDDLRQISIHALREEGDYSHSLW